MLRNVLEEADHYFVRQKKEWTEIVVDFETRNQYEVIDATGQGVGTISEISSGVSGFLKRNFLGSHRALDVRVHDATGEPLMRLARGFFFFFSSLEISAENGAPIGRIARRLGMLHKRYDLLDEQGRVFARVKSPIWRLWTFPVRHVNGLSRATISKKWGGALREVFADADTFRVGLDQGVWTTAERQVLFAAAIAIDFDFFENNQGSNGLLDFFD